jgi:hypothetical protein
MQTRPRKNDATEDKALKRSIHTATTNELQAHMQDSSANHEMYPGTLFPPRRFVWHESGYTDNFIEKVVLTEEEQTLVQTLADLRQEGKEEHYVNVPERQQRAKSRPVSIEVGHYVVCRGDCDSSFPWYIGEVIKVDGQKITICEYDTGAVKPTLNGKIDPCKIRWEARFQGTELIADGRSRTQTVSTTRDEYYPSFHTKPNKPNLYKAVTCEVDIDSIVDWDTQKNMFFAVSTDKVRRRSRGLLLKRWVVQEINRNFRVPWNSTDGPTNGKRPPSSQCQQQNNKRRKK